MNFRTTIYLLVLLVAAGIAVYLVNRNQSGTSEQSSQTETDKGGKKVLTLSAANVNKIVVAPALAARLAFERSGTSDWRITEPVNAPADAFKVDDLLREVLDLRSSGRSDADGKGLDKPTYVVELTDKDNKTTKITVGTRSAVGDILYVRVGDDKQADLVSASIVDQLDKPASEYRKNKLLTTSNDKITGVTVAEETGKRALKLTKSGENWQIVEPKKMPGDSGQVSSLLSAVTGLNAVKFVAEEVKNPRQYGLDKPQMTVTFTTAPPETQPSTSSSTSKPAGETTVIKFGNPQDVLKKNVYATVSDSGPVVTVAASELDQFRKSPLDLRDRKALDVDPNAVSRLSISIDKPATTQPTSQPASKKQVVLERRSEVTQAGPPVPASAPATSPTTKSTTRPTTAPATQPAVPQTKWLVASDPKGDADDTKVQALLDALHPLRAEKYLEKFPTTQTAPAGTYVIKLNTRSWADEPAREHELKITDPGGEAKLVGQLGDLAFEVDRGILEKLTADFAAPKVLPAGPAFPPLRAPPK